MKNELKILSPEKQMTICMVYSDVIFGSVQLVIKIDYLKYIIHDYKTKTIYHMPNSQNTDR
jgi:hypothetical protein